MPVPMDSIQITIAEWDRVKAGHDRYEWLRRQNLATVNVLWRQAMTGDNRFDDLVDELRTAPNAGTEQS